MGTVYLDRSGSDLQLEGGALVVRHGEERQVMPLALLDRVVIAARTRLETPMLLRLAEEGVAVVLFDPRRPARRALVLGPTHNDARVRLGQYRASQEAARRLEFARAWVVAKLRRHERLLRAVSLSRPQAGRTVEEARERLAALAVQAGAAASLAMLRGIEGGAARAFFDAYRRLFPPSLGFAGRRKRPPPDPVNATLSLAYTLLHARAAQTAWGAGLDPKVGFYHEPVFGRESLACDLIEPWRPCVDRWVYAWFRGRWLEAGHFKRRNGGCFLGKAGRNRFFAAFERQVQPVERALRRQCRTLAHQLTEKPDAPSLS